MKVMYVNLDLHELHYYMLVGSYKYFIVANLIHVLILISIKCNLLVILVVTLFFEELYTCNGLLSDIGDLMVAHYDT